MRGRLARILPPGRNRRLYLGITLIDATGSGAFGPITILYLTQVVGLAPVRVGVGLTVAGLFGMAAIPVAGALADRFDARALTAGGFALSAVGFAAYTGVHSFAAFLVVGSFIEIVEGTAKSARRMFAFSLAEGEDRIGLLAYERSTRNVGYGLGGLLASAALAGGSRDAYVAVLLLNAASYAAGTLMVLRLPRALPTAPARDHGGYRTVLRDRMYVALASLSSVLWLNDSVLKVGLALWVVE
ncbi:MAG: MFS transporter, partial [Actinobacteria bacterium]|nr:MFS transporter [Actinomycetota bacterium]